MRCLVKLAWMAVLRVVTALAFAGFLLALCPTATAIIVIDDFDDPVLIEDVDAFLESTGIGDLSAKRFTAFAGSKSEDSMGRLDIATETPGVSTATLFSAGKDPGNGNVSAAFHWSYNKFYGDYYYDVDFTEGGRNDAVIVDVLSMTGATIPRLAVARMISDNGTPLNDNILFDLELSTEPFRLVFRFEDFRPRGGLTGVPPLDLTRTLQADPAPEEAPSQTQSSTPETNAPSLEETLSTPSPEANQHPRYDDIAEILAIAYDYYAGDRQRDAERIWLGLARVFGVEVLPEVIQITKMTKELPNPRAHQRARGFHPIRPILATAAGSSQVC